MWTKPNYASRMGVLLAPLVAPIAVYFLSRDFNPFGYLLFGSAAYLGMFFLGIPALEYLHKRNSAMAFWVVVCGMLSGGVVGVISYVALELIFSGGVIRALHGVVSGFGIIGFGIGVIFGAAVAITYLLISYVTRAK